jgi:hypothetical protein
LPDTVSSLAALGGGPTAPADCAGWALWTGGACCATLDGAGPAGRGDAGRAVGRVRGASTVTGGTCTGEDGGGPGGCGASGACCGSGTCSGPVCAIAGDVSATHAAKIEASKRDRKRLESMWPPPRRGAYATMTPQHVAPWVTAPPADNEVRSRPDFPCERDRP